MSGWEIMIALVSAVLLAPLVGGRWNVPLAAWLLPVFLLAAGQQLDLWQAYALAVTVLCLGGLVSLAGQVPLPLVWYVGYVVAIEAIAALAYLAGHLVTRLTDGFAGTLAFPVAVVAIELVSAAVGPFGQWGSLAYTQYGNLPLMQLAAVGGNAAITFLVSWFGSTAGWAWAHDFAPDRVGVGLATYAVVLVGVLLAGGLRLARSRHTGRTVRIASLTEPELPGMLPTREAFGLLMTDGDIADGKWAAIKRTGTACCDALLEATAAQARAGARIVFWAECAGLVTAEGEPELVSRAGELAREHGCYLAMALTVAHRAGPRHLDNKVVLLTPTGEVAFEYRKGRPVPGVEAAHSLPGGSPMRWLDTEYGRIGVLICFDVDIPSIARQIGAAGLDILLVPASDWAAIDPLHSQMAALRGVEHGTSVVRQARWGLSMATDAYGRVLAAHDDDPSGATQVMVAYVPTTGAGTVRGMRRAGRASRSAGEPVGSGTRGGAGKPGGSGPGGTTTLDATYAA